LTGPTRRAGQRHYGDNASVTTAPELLPGTTRSPRRSRRLRRRQGHDRHEGGRWATTSCRTCAGQGRERHRNNFGERVAVGPQNLTLEKTVDKPTIGPYEPVIYSYKVTNTGATPLSGIVVEDDNARRDTRSTTRRGTIALLAPNASASLTASSSRGVDPRRGQWRDGERRLGDRGDDPGVG